MVEYVEVNDKIPVKFSVAERTPPIRLREHVRSGDTIEIYKQL